MPRLGDGAAHRRARRSSTIFDYHADTVALGGMAEAAGVGHLVLTHLIPPPTDAAAEQAFADDVREGGYTGALTVGHDLFTVELT